MLYFFSFFLFLFLLLLFQPPHAVDLLPRNPDLCILNPKPEALAVGWPAHRGGHAATSLAFSADQNAVFSVGTDGVVSEWSLHKFRTVLHSVNVSRACGLVTDYTNTSTGTHIRGGTSRSGSPGAVATSDGGGGSGYLGVAAAAGGGGVGGSRLRLALDPNGHGLVLSSRSADAALVCLDPGGSGGTVHALSGHAGPVTCVDWHPTKSVALTGSSDNSMQVTHLAMGEPSSSE